MKKIFLFIAALVTMQTQGAERPNFNARFLTVKIKFKDITTCTYSFNNYREALSYVEKIARAGDCSTIYAYYSHHIDGFNFHINPDPETQSSLFRCNPGGKLFCYNWNPNSKKFQRMR